MAVPSHDFDPGLLPRPSWKLRAAAVMLAGFGGVGSIWLALDGQKVKTQEAVYVERQAFLTRLGAETAAMQARIEEQRAQAAAAEDRLTQARRALADVEATRASAASARDQIETERFAATVTRTALLKAIEAEQQKLEQAKAETSAARLELEKAAVAARSLDPQRRELAALRAEFEEILTRKRERETAVALLRA
jgi:chromosome segregation ATPase